jgi:transcriptional regulator with XRE-family HTH domain
VISERVLGERVRAARMSAGLSQQDMARAIGVDQPAVSRIEAGRDVSSILLAKIADATSQDFDFFLRNEDTTDAGALLRQGDADSDAVARAVAQLTRFVNDYEFLLDLT